MTRLQLVLTRHGKWIGAAMGAAAFIVFVFAFAQLLSADRTVEMISGHWQVLLLALALYAVAFVPVTAAWIVLARKSGIVAPAWPLARIFLISQIGKYVPGNVGQFVGRVFLAKRYGLPLDRIGAAMVLEIAVVLAVGAIAALLATSMGTVTGAGLIIPGLAGLAAALAMVLCAIWLRRHNMQSSVFSRFEAAAALCYLLMFGLLASAIFLMLGMVSDSWGTSLWWQVFGALVVSWLVGFITPGAPAGIGLRELGLVTLLSGAYPLDALLFAVAGFRIATMVGDALAYAVGMLLPATGTAN